MWKPCRVISAELKHILFGKLPTKTPNGLVKGGLAFIVCQLKNSWFKTLVYLFKIPSCVLKKHTEAKILVVEISLIAVSSFKYRVNSSALLSFKAQIRIKV